MRKPVLCEVDERKLPIRIFRVKKKAYLLPVEQVEEFEYAFAVGVIRRLVFLRAGCTRTQAGKCEHCGKPITWDGGHMHETLPKGKGGEVSVENSVAICPSCHLGKDGAHGNRRWHSSKIKE